MIAYTKFRRKFDGEKKKMKEETFSINDEANNNETRRKNLKLKNKTTTTKICIPFWLFLFFRCQNEIFD